MAKKKTDYILNNANLITQNKKLAKKINDQTEVIQLLQEQIVLENVLDTSNLVAPSLHFKPELLKPNQSTIITVNSDWHAESEVKPEWVNGWNKYTPDIYVQSKRTYFELLVQEIKRTIQFTPVSKIIVGCLGDAIQGYLREDDIESNLLAPMEAIRLVEEEYIRGFRYLAENVGDIPITVIMLSGNHSRTTEYERPAGAYRHSYEYHMSVAIKNLFEQKLVGYNNVQIILPTTKLFGFKIAEHYPVTFSHGNHFRYQGGIGGLEIPMYKWDYRAQSVEKAKRRYIGHHHTLKFGKVCVNGAGIGYSHFAMEKQFEPERPAMIFEVIDHHLGHVLSKPLILRDFWKFQQKKRYVGTGA